MMRQVAAGRVKVFARREMLELVMVDGQARGIVGAILSPANWRRKWLIGAALHRRIRNVFYLSTNAINSSYDCSWMCRERGIVRESVLHTDSPDLHPATGDSSPS